MNDFMGRIVHDSFILMIAANTTLEKNRLNTEKNWNPDVSYLHFYLSSCFYPYFLSFCDAMNLFVVARDGGLRSGPIKGKKCIIASCTRTVLYAL